MDAVVLIAGGDWREGNIQKCGSKAATKPLEDTTRPSGVAVANQIDRHVGWLHRLARGSTDGLGEIHRERVVVRQRKIDPSRQRVDARRACTRLEHQLVTRALA